MQKLPDIERNKEILKYAVLFCEKRLGNEANYKLDILEGLATKYADIIKLIENCDETKVNRIKMTCGCLKREVECLATQETMLYYDLIELKNNIERIITILKVNNLKGTKGFTFSNEEIVKSAEYLYLQEMRTL